MPDGKELVKKMFHESYRVLKPGGVFMCVCVQSSVKTLLDEIGLPWSMGKLEVKTALVNDSHAKAQDHVTVICCRKKKQAGFTKVQGLMARLLIAAKKKELLEQANEGAADKAEAGSDKAETGSDKAEAGSDKAEVAPDPESS